MSIPTPGEKFAELIEYLRKGQEAAAMLGHLHADNDKLLSHGYLGMAELLGRAAIQVTQMATKRMH